MKASLRYERTNLRLGEMLPLHKYGAFLSPMPNLLTKDSQTAKILTIWD
jgi:hypothetical protein